METSATQDHLQQVILIAQGFYARKDCAHDLEHALRVRELELRFSLILVKQGTNRIRLRQKSYMMPTNWTL